MGCGGAALWDYILLRRDDFYGPGVERAGVGGGVVGDGQDPVALGLEALESSAPPCSILTTRSPA
jgi:hypothetical protein